MRNAVKRVTHKERSQPSDRKKLGLLEKHKDYIIRAKDYHKKEKLLKNLKRKAADRNPDEFYFQMNNSQVEKGIHHDTKTSELSASMVKLLKTQDMGYIAVRKTMDDKKVERIKSGLHLIGEVVASSKTKKHTIFVDNSEELDTFDAATHFNTAPQLVDRAFNRPLLSNIDSMYSNNRESSDQIISEDKVRKSTAKKEKLYKELTERTKRSKKLETAYFQLSQQRNVQNSKGSKRKIVITRDSKGEVVKQNSNSKKNKAKEEEDKDLGKTRETVLYKWKRQRTR